MATKTAKSNVWAAFDSDEEDNHCCGGCGSAPAPKKVAGMTLEQMEQAIVRRRFWPYPSEAEERLPSAWPCNACCPWQHDEGDFWECEHGKWLWVDSWDSVPALPEDHSLRECRGGSCPGHGLMSGDILMLHLASEAGIMWGDIVFYEEQERLAAETPAERAARVAEEARKERERVRAMAEAEKRMAAELVKTRAAPQERRYDRRTGKPMPCQYYMYQGVLGREHPAENGWEAGCGYHKKGKCPFFHPDEPEWQIIIGKAAMPSRPATPEPEWRSSGGSRASGAGGGGFSRPSSGGGGNSSRPSSGGGGSSRANGGAGGKSGRGGW